MRHPNFFIIGAPKCGTTALTEYLQTHPDIFITNPKEPHFFSKNDIAGYEGVSTLDDYLRLYSAIKEQKMVGEASVLYLYSSEALAKIKSFAPKAKIIVMLRKTSEYIYSYHSQLLLNGDENIMSFEEAWGIEHSRKKGKHIPKYCRAEKLLYYRDVGRLGNQLERLYTIFSGAQVHVIFLEDMAQNPKEVYKSVLQFLGVDDDGRTDFPVINENKKNRLNLLGDLWHHPPVWLTNISNNFKKTFRLQDKNLGAILHRWNRQTVKRDPIDKQFNQKLIDEFTSDIDKLAHLTGRDLSHWK